VSCWKAINLDTSQPGVVGRPFIWMIHDRYTIFILKTYMLHLYMSYSYYIVAVGCGHTGYKSLMAGLVTEWILNAFAV
jgi:hypothetical protein